MTQFNLGDKVKLKPSEWGPILSNSVGEIESITSFNDEYYDEDDNLEPIVVTEYTIIFNPPAQEDGIEFTTLTVLGDEIELVSKYERPITGFSKFLRRHEL